MCYLVDGFSIKLGNTSEVPGAVPVRKIEQSGRKYNIYKAYDEKTFVTKSLL